MYDFNFQPVIDNLDMLFWGAVMTVQLSTIAMMLGFVVSVLGAVARISGPRPLRWFVGAYIEAIRNTPFLIQISFIFFGLPSIGISFSPNTAALVALVINVGAYGTEIVRAGIQATPPGRIEAGRALGMNPVQVFIYIVLKPALRNVYPALTGQFIYLMMMSSVVSVISANDLAAAGADLNGTTFASFEIYLTLTAIYLGLALGYSAVFSFIRRALFAYPEA